MAWLAELKRRAGRQGRRTAWHCINGVAMDAWYWKQWYASLSGEQKKDLLYYKIRKENTRGAKTAIAQLLGAGMVIGAMNRNTKYFV